MLKLYWHNYKLMDYEKRLGLKELNTLMKPESIIEYKDFLEIKNPKHIDKFVKLTYFDRMETPDEIIYTQEALLEHGYRKINNYAKRQVTRYSVHGLHEYKGKYNPQIVRCIINLLELQDKDKILDPFCGSGTTLIESQYAGLVAKGTDINGLAVAIANAKLESLVANIENLESTLRNIVKEYKEIRSEFNIDNLYEDDRLKYLKIWFKVDYLTDLECLRLVIEKYGYKNIFLIGISNILKDYSEQEPADLRIRRRYKTEYPEIDIVDRFNNEMLKYINNIKVSRNIKNFKDGLQANAINIDIRNLKSKEGFNGAITSPPYATALPYVDTQRLSIVWMGICSPRDISKLQSELIGSREIKTTTKREIEGRLINNIDELPTSIVSLCVHLNNSLIDTDGFRRRAVPTLLYRYFSDMKIMFQNVLKALKEDAKFALVVGHNHTVIGGERYNIDTPKFLVDVAINCGWIHEETIKLEVYSRYGLNKSNAIEDESLIILRKMKQNKK
nr:DNA adenine methylase [Clostridioides sp.]